MKISKSFIKIQR